MSLQGKTALVTGGSRGIGAAIAKRLAADDAAVAITYAGNKAAADATVAAAFPHVPVIVPHFGGGFLREALMAAEACPNIVFDTSSSNSCLISSGSRRLTMMLGPLVEFDTSLITALMRCEWS